MSWYQPVKRAAGAAALGGAIAAVSLSVTAGSALAKTTHHQKHPAVSITAPVQAPGASKSVMANFSSGPLNAQFTAHLGAGLPETAATGTFHADLTVLGEGLVQLNGPVTCLAINGPDIGIFYPVTSSVPASVASVMKGVYVNVEMGANGRPLSFSFRPSLLASDSHCDPLPGLLPITSGTVSIGS